MITLIEILLAILFVVCLGLFMLHKYDSEAIRDLKNDNRQLSDEIKRIKTRQTLLEQKLIKLSDNRDKIEIVHKYDDSGAPDFPNSRRS
jgi:cell division protein FtsB